MLVSAREQMPRRRSGHTTSVSIGAERFHLTANQRDDGSLVEVFIAWGKPGLSAAGLVAAYAVALSMGLQHGVPLADLIRPGLGQYFVPNGHTDDPEIPRVRSAVDYIARRLAIDWMAYPDRAALGVLTLTERVRQASAWMAASEPALPLTGRARQQPGRHDLEYLAQGGGEVLVPDRQRRVGLVGGQHGRARIRVWPQGTGGQGGGGRQPDRVVWVQFAHAAQEQAAQCVDGIDAGPLVLGRHLR
jgi:hypothetical protein